MNIHLSFVFRFVLFSFHVLRHLLIIQLLQPIRRHLNHLRGESAEFTIGASNGNNNNKQVGWLRADDQTILSLHRRVVTHNPRVSVTHDESRTWNLHIRQIKESDQGCYMCQVINN